MVSIAYFEKLAMALPEVTKEPHFEKDSFRVKGKIFSTLHADTKKAMVKLSLVEQSVFSDIDKTIIYPVPGGWGRQGATLVELAKVKREILRAALEAAWCNVAPTKMIEKYFPGNKITE